MARLSLTFARKAALARAATVALTTAIVSGLMTTTLQDPSAALIGAQEAVLKETLFRMRDAIDQYYADQKHYPSGLASLVSERYIREIPTDPFTNRSDSWQAIPAKPNPNNPTVAPGIDDVRSGSEATAADGTKYSDW